MGALGTLRFGGPPPTWRGNPEKNWFFRGPFHNPLIIIIYNRYNVAYNPPFLSFALPFFHSFHRDFFFVRWGPPRHVPIVPRPQM